MIKAMLFGDGDWLNTHLAAHDPTGLDLARLTAGLVAAVGEHIERGPVDLVRAHWYASDARHGAHVRQQPAQGGPVLPDHSGDPPGIELRRCPIEPHGPWRRPNAQADQGASGAPMVALAVDLMRQASIPGSFDLAILLVGDRAYLPLLQEVRRQGRRIVLVGLAGASTLIAGEGAPGGRDFAVLWLDHHLGRLVSGRGSRPDRRVGARPGLASELPTGDLHGRIKNVIREKGYGFIAAADGHDYFFHANTLTGGLVFDQLPAELPVIIEVKNGPTGGRAGAAGSVRPDPGRGVPAAGDLDPPAVTSPGAAEAPGALPEAADGDLEPG